MFRHIPCKNVSNFSSVPPALCYLIGEEASAPTLPFFCAPRPSIMGPKRKQLTEQAQAGIEKSAWGSKIGIAKKVRNDGKSKLPC